MSKLYPNIDGEKSTTKGKCLECGTILSAKNPGKKLNVEYTWMNGDDESETYCNAHAAAFKRKLDARDRRYEERLAAEWKREVELKDSLFNRLAAVHQVQKLTECQWRVNGVLDVYPTNRRYHDIKKNVRGGYDDVLSFCKSYFRTAA